jgi:indole-3-acetate monooxygenase
MSVTSAEREQGSAIADVRAICVYATDEAIETATMGYHVGGNHRTAHPDLLGRLLRDLNIAGFHPVMSDTAYENRGNFRLGLRADPVVMTAIRIRAESAAHRL